MEKEKEIKKLTQVLRQIAHAGKIAMWRGEDRELSKYSVAQFNKIVARLTELEPSLAALFTPLPEEASMKTIHLAARELVAYIEEDAPKESWERERHHQHRAWRRERRCCGIRRVRVVWSPFVSARGRCC